MTSTANNLVPCHFCKGRPGRVTCPTCKGAGEVDESIRSADMADFWRSLFVVFDAMRAENETAAATDTRAAA